MKRSVWMGLLVLLLALPTGLPAQDMRAASVELKKQKEALLEKARQEKAQAEKEAAESRRRILADRQKLEAAIAELKTGNTALKETIDQSEKTLEALFEREKTLNEQLREKDAVVRELVGFVRSNAKDLETLLQQSPQSALFPIDNALLQGIVDQTRFPGMGDIRRMADLLFSEIQRSGEVRIQAGTIVDRAGKETQARILTLGNFTAAYQHRDETGFLLYSDNSQRFFALSKLPKPRTAQKIQSYMNGKSVDVPIDISRGAALRQLSHQLSLWEQIPKGGPIVWPILGILAIAVLIILERMVYLFRVHVDADSLMNKVNQFAAEHRWDECLAFCKDCGDKCIPRVIQAGAAFKDMNREDMENALQEAILNEVPKLERFLSTLGMLAAIAPLLGLLGTVTGMINTFHVITFYGTGDPKMMSGGISEALVTTMLGLSVAIPIMLCHTLLTRRVENIIGQMEEKAVSFVNTIYKIRHAA